MDLENLRSQFTKMIKFIGWRPTVGAIIGEKNDAAEFLVVVMTSIIAELKQVSKILKSKNEMCPKCLHVHSKARIELSG